MKHDGHCPSPRGPGGRLRGDEEWFPQAYAALEALNARSPKPGGRCCRLPLLLGTWGRPRAHLAGRPGARRFPWLDDPDAFVAATAPFLTG
ncbi:hypothetical protein [Streptomyces candidus]|uniref:Uncharacterized protein n=1 Tax=Streptomyces candidus TaxID=67283 RepID=A0A7X0LRR5_9ACTN|nr:hypothetical protein [Streptomyces candidus]MBB6438928.1 hypothetical protein [Streptomyces candidus]GHH44284.1 hypothetical protein GCM10018773_31640 [Streptomyces candidus]